MPVHVIHGDADDFAPIELAERLVAESRCRRPMRFIRVPGANHFLNDGPVDVLMSVLEQLHPGARAAEAGVQAAGAAEPGLADPQAGWTPAIRRGEAVGA